MGLPLLRYLHLHTLAIVETGKSLKRAKSIHVPNLLAANESLKQKGINFSSLAFGRNWVV